MLMDTTGVYIPAWAMGLILGGLPTAAAFLRQYWASKEMDRTLRSLHSRFDVLEKRVAVLVDRSERDEGTPIHGVPILVETEKS